MASLRSIVGTLMLFLNTAYVIAQIVTESTTLETATSTNVPLSTLRPTTSSTALTGSTTAYVIAQTTSESTFETATTSTAFMGSTNGPTVPTDQKESADLQSTGDDDDDDLLLGIAIGAGAVSGAVIIACVVILVALRLHAMKKRRIATSPPDTQPLEVKNEQSAEQP